MNDRVLGEAMESLHGYNPTKDKTEPVAHLHQCEYERHRGKEDLGCKCECGALMHLMGWQTITTLPEPPEPEPEPVFDVEEYRQDLQRRYDTLTKDAEDARARWNLFPVAGNRDTMNRLCNKAAGLRIALDLLPEEAPVKVYDWLLMLYIKAMVCRPEPKVFRLMDQQKPGPVKQPSLVGVLLVAMAIMASALLGVDVMREVQKP